MYSLRGASVTRKNLKIGLFLAGVTPIVAGFLVLHTVSVEETGDLTVEHAYNGF